MLLTIAKYLDFFRNQKQSISKPIFVHSDFFFLLISRVRVKAQLLSLAIAN